MRRRRRDVALLLVAALGVTDAAYLCTPLGTECDAPNYAGGHFTDQAALLAACDAAGVTCSAYQWSAVANSGWMCTGTATRVDHHAEVVHCVKPESPHPPPQPPPPPPSRAPAA